MRQDLTKEPTKTILGLLQDKDDWTFTESSIGTNNTLTHVSGFVISFTKTQPFAFDQKIVIIDMDFLDEPERRAIGQSVANVLNHLTINTDEQKRQDLLEEINGLLEACNEIEEP